MKPLVKKEKIKKGGYVNKDSLVNLKDIHLPETISNWPPAYGWWIVAILSLTLLGFTCFYLIKSYQQSAYRRSALNLFEDINTDYHQHGNAKVWLNDITNLLKRTCIIAYPKASFAELSGSEWLEFLDSKIKNKKKSKEPDKFKNEKKHKKPTNKTILFSKPGVQNIFNKQFQSGPITLSKKGEDYITSSVIKWVKQHQ